jgi:hypothetical protein
MESATAIKLPEQSEVTIDQLAYQCQGIFRSTRVLAHLLSSTSDPGGYYCGADIEGDLSCLLDILSTRGMELTEHHLE